MCILTTKLFSISELKKIYPDMARWMEELSIYDCKFIHIRGQNNTMADALSRYPSTQTCSNSVAEHHANHPHIGFKENDIIILDRSSSTSSLLTSIASLTDANNFHTKLEFSIDTDTITKIKDGYKKDPWCQKLISAS